jgi:hypothetical protein
MTRILSWENASRSGESSQERVVHAMIEKLIDLFVKRIPPKNGSTTGPP